MCEPVIDRLCISPEEVTITKQSALIPEEETTFPPGLNPFGKEYPKLVKDVGNDVDAVMDNWQNSSLYFNTNPFAREVVFHPFTVICILLLFAEEYYSFRIVTTPLIPVF